jgi:abortive infection bacteriophage resistance protein
MHTVIFLNSESRAPENSWHVTMDVEFNDLSYTVNQNPWSRKGMYVTDTLRKTRVASQVGYYGICKYSPNVETVLRQGLKSNW